MADGNTGDNHKTPADQPAVAPPPVDKDGHTAKLQLDSQPHGTDKTAKPGDAATVTDSTAKTSSEKALERLSATTTKPAEESQAHLQAASKAANEIAGYVKSGKKEGDLVPVKGEDGKDKTETVADRVKELKVIVDKECSASVGLSNNIKQSDVSSLLQVARNERNGLAKDLGVSQDKFNTTAIDQLIKGTSDSGTVAKLEQLKRAQTVVDQGKIYENMPAYTRMYYASFKAGGLTDPTTGMVKDKNGGLNPSQKDVLDAVQLLNEAGGNNKDLRVSSLYLHAVATVLPKLENSSAKVKTITDDLQNATVAGAKGDKVQQEKLLKDAVAQADQTNTAAIAQMLRDPRFTASQRNPAVLTDMANNVVMSSTARLQYAQFLVDNSRFAEAQGLAMRVKTECPEVMYSHDANDPNKINYNQSRFVDMAKLDHSLAVSTTVQPNQIKNLLDDFSSAMTKGQIDSKDGVKGAHDILSDLYVAANKKTAEVADGQKGMAVSQKDLDQRKADLAKKNYLTDDAKLLEQKQLDREQAMIQQQKALLDADAKEAARLTNVVKLYDAGLDVSEEKRSSARTLLAQIKASDPSMAAATGPDGKDSFYATLDKAAQEPGWWDRNWRKVATVGAVVAGAAVGALTFWSGPGALVFGAGTTAAIMTSVGVGVTAGAIAGGGTFLATHEGLYHTGVVKEKVNALRDFEQGAGAGALGAITMIGLPAMAAVGGIGGGAAATGAAVEGAAATTSTLTTLGNLGIQSLKLGAVSFAGSVPYATADYFATDPAKRDIHSFYSQVGFGTAVPMALPFGAAGLRLGATGLRAIGLMKAAAPVVAAASETAPSIWAASNLRASGLAIGLLEGVKATPEWINAYNDGPAYAYGPNGTVSPEIANATSIFGPYNNVRGYEAYRQKDDFTGERSDIQSNWTDYDPGVIKMGEMATEKPVNPIVQTNSDFTDAQKLGSDTTATPPANPPANPPATPAAPDKPKQ